MLLGVFISISQSVLHSYRGEFEEVVGGTARFEIWDILDSIDGHAAGYLAGRDAGSEEHGSRG